MITPAGMKSDEQASRLVLKDEFLARAKSLSNLQEVFRSSLVTQILTDALAVGPEPLLIGKFAKVLAVHAAERAADLNYATEAVIKAFREAAEEGYKWFIADTAPLLAFAKGRASSGDLLKVKMHPRAAVNWLPSKPKRQHLVPESLRRFLQVDADSADWWPFGETTPQRFALDYINAQQGQGRRPTQKGLEDAARKAGLRGRRDALRAAFHGHIETRRGRPSKRD
jgi:hypothetical protein